MVKDEEEGRKGCKGQRKNEDEDGDEKVIEVKDAMPTQRHSMSRRLKKEKRNAQANEQWHARDTPPNLLQKLDLFAKGKGIGVCRPFLSVIKSGQVRSSCLALSIPRTDISC